MAERLETERLILRPWAAGDAGAALRAYGDAEVARWLAPAMDQVGDEAAMRVVLQDGSLIGGATLLPLPPDEEYEIGWQLQRDAWGNGYATEIGRALAGRAFEQGLEQVIAVVRPANTRAVATLRRIGMEWIGETEKYHHLRLQHYRLRPADLAAPAH
jgi:ribosomal-protein-alanine N-acetyltransferase